MWSGVTKDIVYSPNNVQQLPLCYFVLIREEFKNVSRVDLFYYLMAKFQLGFRLLETRYRMHDGRNEPEKYSYNV